jgi:glycosyltransferase involved in cell wall biosynthesis
VTRVSVILASYNGAAYIGEQLRSIVAQIGPDDEVLVCDDGSVDATLDAVRAVADSRIRVLPGGRRLGYVKNFERGVHNAAGSVLLFSDQDDVWCEERLPATLRLLEDRACVCGDASVTDAEMREVAPSFWALRKPLGFGALALAVRPAVIGATLGCRASFVRSLLPFPAGVPHDMWISVNAAMRGELAVATIPFIRYRRHSGAASLTTHTGKGRGVFPILRERALLGLALARPGLA